MSKKDQLKKKNFRNWIDTDAIPTIPSEMVLSVRSHSGVFFGDINQYKQDYFVGIPQGADGNILVVGGNGNGKSSGIAMPTLMTWKGAICATDVKGELSRAYQEFYWSSFRQGNFARPYIIFDPTQLDGPSYDPLWWVLHDCEENLISNIREIAHAIIPALPNDKDPFWLDTERDIFSAALLHYFKLGLSFSEIVCKIMNFTLSQLCEDLKGSDYSQAKLFLGGAAALKPELFAAVERGLRNKLSDFAADPYIGHAFRGAREGTECFSWNDLKEYNIFLKIPADRITQWGMAITLMYSQLLRYLEQRPDQYSKNGENNTQTLLLMDEFARFGKLERITDAMATLRSKNVNICLIIQSIAQLDKIYGECDRRIIVDNCQYQAILCANDSETQKYLSERIGTTKSIKKNMSAHTDTSGNITGYARQISEVREFQVFPHELATLDDILLLSPYGFCRVNKLPPQYNLTKQIISAASSVRQTATLPSIFEPITLHQNILTPNEDTKMLTNMQRLQNAEKRIAESQRLQRLEQKKERELQEKKDKRRNFIIGELVTKYFPEVSSIELSAKAENAECFSPLEAFLIELASDQELVAQIKEKALYWQQPGAILRPEDLQCVSGHEVN